MRLRGGVRPALMAASLKTAHGALASHPPPPREAHADSAPAQTSGVLQRKRRRYRPSRTT